MTAAIPTTEKQFKKAQSALRRKAFLLVAPLLLFIVTVFVVPIILILYTSFYNDEVSANIPNTIIALEKDWPDHSVAPPESVFAAFVKDISAAKKAFKHGSIATRLNYEKAGMRSMVKKVAKRADKLEAPFKDAVANIDERWLDPFTWQIIKREGNGLTASFYVSALDLEYNQNEELVSRDSERSIYIMLFARTFILAAFVTLFCIILGFPVAYLLSTLPDKIANLMMIMVLLPFWTSLLVRTTSWIVLLQTHGPLNDLFVALGIADDENRIRMIYNMGGTLIAMTHILLPFMILPIYSIMKNIPSTYMRAAISLGANWGYAFRRVYLPLTVPGIGAGGLLVFILSIGYYITPALVGGSSGQLISNLIAYHLEGSLNWGLAAALSGLLLIAVLLLYWVYNRWFGIDKIRF